MGATRARRLPAVGSLLADITPLREVPAFRRLWAGSTLSAVGSSLTAFAVMLQIYELTRSPLAVGATGIAQMVPTLAVGLLGGPVTDAADRRKVVLVTSSCLAVVSAGFAAQAFAGSRLVWLLYALVAVQSSLAAVDRPTRNTFVPRLLPASQLPAGLALQQITFQVMLTAGPALAGVVAAAPHLGLRFCYLLDAFSYAGALYGVARLPAMRPTGGGTQLSVRAFTDGIAFIRRSQVLAGAFLTDLSATVFGLPVALFPAINAERFGGSPRTLGLFMTSVGVGGLICAGFSGPVRHVRRPGRVMLVAVGVWGAAFAGFAVVPGLWLTLGLVAVAGAADTITVVCRSTIVAAVTPDELRGRVMAADYVVGAGGGQIGNLEAGALGSLTSPVISAVSGGVVNVLAAVVLSLAMPAFTRYRHQPEQPARTGEPGAGKPGAGKPGASQPGASEPSTGEPSTGEPSTGEPSTGEPSTAPDTGLQAATPATP